MILFVIVRSLIDSYNRWTHLTEGLRSSSDPLLSE